MLKLKIANNVLVCLFDLKNVENVQYWHTIYYQT